VSIASVLIGSQPHGSQSRSEIARYREALHDLRELLADLTVAPVLSEENYGCMWCEVLSDEVTDLFKAESHKADCPWRIASEECMGLVEAGFVRPDSAYEAGGR
jgi:hypothetical protein